MQYAKTKPANFFRDINTEESARHFLWQAKFDGKEFVCPRCNGATFYQLKRRAEVRQCRGCRQQVRLRANTIFESSKLPLLQWLRAVYLMMQDKRGVSALQLKRLIGMKSYDTTWRWLHKIRRALAQRDDHYKLKNVIELDGATFPSRYKRKPTDVLVAIETKGWIDENGRQKSKAGFAKVCVAAETKIFTQRFIDQAIAPGAMVNTDGGSAFKDLKNVDAEQQVMHGQPERLNHWLPWVHRFIANAKIWLIGTHHGGVRGQYLHAYLAEFTYRFNRRHDPDGLFHRAAAACARATPITSAALLG